MKMELNLAKKRLRYNKNRTILTGIAVLLTTMLLAGLGTCSVGLLDINKKQAAAESNVHATLKDLTREQMTVLKNHVDVEAVELSEIFASVECKETNVLLTYNERLKGSIYRGIGNITEGKMPERADEICGPASVFELLGTEAAVGNTVKLSFRPNGKGKIQTRQFVICGITSERDISNLDVSGKRLIYGAQVSEALVEEYLSVEERSCNAVIRVYGEEELDYDEITAKIRSIAGDIGCREEDVSLNEMYLITATDAGMEMIGIVGGIALIIIIVAALVIYSIYYVSVITDVQEIGRLKALGASPGQVKGMLLGEGLLVSAVSVPAGLFLGYTAVYLLLPLVMREAARKTVMTMPAEKTEMFSMPVFFVTICLALLTVLVSLRKPMKIAAKISPVEAMRYQESSSGKKLRKGNAEINLMSLCLANLTRNKRRTIVTILTMGLSCMLFMGCAGVLNSMRAESIARIGVPRGDFAMEIDYSLNDETYPENNLDNLQKKELLGGDLLERIRKTDGVKKVEKGRRMLISSDRFREKGHRDTLSDFTREEVKELLEDLKQGEIDYDRMLAENGAVFTRDYFRDNYDFQVGDTVPVRIHDGGRTFDIDIKIEAFLQKSSDAVFLIPQEVYEQLGIQADDTSELYIYAEDGRYDEVKAQLTQIAGEDEHLSLSSMDEEMRLGEVYVSLTKCSMYLLLGIIAVIGFMNLVNTMVTSVVTRKREFGLLQAVGLSDRQLVRMISAEGLVFTAGALILALTLGNVLGYQLFLWAKENGVSGVKSYCYPVRETTGLTAALVLGQLAVTRRIGKWVRRESLIERIRSGE